MGFNLVKYNLSSFNRSNSTEIYIKIKGAESITAAIGIALNYFGFAIGNEKVNKPSLTGVQAKFIEAVFEEIIDKSTIEAQASAILSSVFSEEIDSDAKLSAEIRPFLLMSENVTENIIVSPNLFLKRQGLEEINNGIQFISARVHPDVAGYEFINSSASLRNIDTKVCILTTTLKPGEILIVDANNYNVLLNSQNAIEIQSGDWIDELNRNTTEIKLTASSGMANMSATILYTEKYL